MQNTLTRGLLNPKLTWHSGTIDNIQTHTRDDINHCITQWKHVLEHQAGYGRGCQIFLDFKVKDINWLAITVANWELGGKQTSFHPTYPDLWTPWHVVVTDNADTEALKPHALHYFSSDTAQYIDHNVVDNVPICQPGDQVYGFNTSGSTGTPTKINYSHEFMSALCHRNISV
jgi:hypothetical protein